MLYSFLKFIHVLGVVVLLGNGTITAFWKVFADRTKDASLIAHAQQAVSVSDWLFTLTGIAMIIGGGYGMVYVAGLDPLSSWLVKAQVLFMISGLMWLGILVPLQVRQARAARQFKDGSSIPDAYWRDCRSWLVWGIAATVPLVAAVYVMITPG